MWRSLSSAAGAAHSGLPQLLGCLGGCWGLAELFLQAVSEGFGEALSTLFSS